MGDPIDGANAAHGVAQRFQALRSWMGGEDDKAYGTEEETQGLLGLAQESLHGATDKASTMLGASMGGTMGFAVHAASVGKQRWASFFVLLALGCVLLTAAFASLPLLVLMPHKFAMVFTIGSLCLFGSLAALKGSDHLSLT